MYVCRFLSCWAVSHRTYTQHGYCCSSKTSDVLARCYHDLCLTLVVGYIKYQNLWLHPCKFTWWSSVVLMWNLLCLFHFNANFEMNSSVRWVSSWINCIIKFLIDSIKCLLKHGCIKNRHTEQASLTIWKAECKVVFGMFLKAKLPCSQAFQWKGCWHCLFTC